ncbi:MULTISPECIES: DUF3592 domain-containing protein [Myroides]|uniref:DUF3592 domain-containing protein n=1 Tax=Myroides TaxID=76831 RepID=UPI000280AA5B|nr:MULTISPECIES: DUF3592 domain-containing protein [Myroides]EKB04547.1 hypothetical protein HMPREF9711_01876 [Myroides odoratimimus CCUG 3837]
MDIIKRELMFLLPVIIGIVISIILGKLINRRCQRYNSLPILKDLGKGTYFILLGIMWVTYSTGSLLYNVVSNKVNIISNGDKYMAKVVSYTTYKTEGSRSKRGSRSGSINYKPIVTFTTKDKVSITHTLDSSVGDMPIKGQGYVIYYNPKTEKITTLNTSDVIVITGFSIVFILIAFVFVTMFSFAIGAPMMKYKKVGTYLLFLFVIPISMLSLMFAFIYTLLYSNAVSAGMSLVLIFVILLIIAGIYGVLKTVMSENGIIQKIIAWKPN